MLPSFISEENQSKTNSSLRAHISVADHTVILAHFPPHLSKEQEDMLEYKIVKMY